MMKYNSGIFKKRRNTCLVEDLEHLSATALYSGEPCGKDFNFAPAFASLDRLTERSNNFNSEVVKAYNMHSSLCEGISFHGPDTHGGSHPLHTQLTFFNREKHCHGALRFNLDLDE